MTDLNTLTKTKLNALLVTPLSASALKKTSKDDLVAMFDAMPAADALDADLRDARTDDPTTVDYHSLLTQHFRAMAGLETVKALPAPPLQIALDDALAQQAQTV